MPSFTSKMEVKRILACLSLPCHWWSLALHVSYDRCTRLQIKTCTSDMRKFCAVKSFVLKNCTLNKTFGQWGSLAGGCFKEGDNAPVLSTLVQDWGT